MAKKTVKVALPIRKILELLVLVKAVFVKHTSLGEGSPVKNVDMDDFDDKTKQIEILRAEAAVLRAQSEAKMEQAQALVGTAPGQDSSTPGTIYNDLTKIRNQLLVTYDGNEELLSEWGFKVVVSTPTYKHKTKE
jgi:hypothetical protein